MARKRKKPVPWTEIELRALEQRAIENHRRSIEAIENREEMIPMYASQALDASRAYSRMLVDNALKRRKR